MTRFYFVRHGKTEFNQADILQGARVDSPLLVESIVNAKKTGAYLQDVSFAKAYVSPQKRAQDTAKAVISQLKVRPEIITADELREFDFGDWDGDPIAKHSSDPRLYDFIHDPLHFDGSSFNAESYLDLKKRVTCELEKIFQAHPTDDVLVAAHALVISIGVKSLLVTDFNTIRKEGLVANTSITVLETDDFKDFELKTWNYTKHLE